MGVPLQGVAAIDCVALATLPEIGEAFMINERALIQSSFDGGGTGMSNVAELTPVKPVEAKEIETPVLPAELLAVNPEKVATPETAGTVVVPPKVQIPEVVRAVAVIAAVLLVKLPY